MNFKIDFDLLRKILLKLEETQLYDRVYIESVDVNTVGYHLTLLEEHKFITTSFQQRYNNYHDVSITRIFSKGLEFISLAKKKAEWLKAIETLSANGAYISPFDVYQELKTRGKDKKKK